MTERDECCGWASWGELAGMGDGRVRVNEWEEPSAGVGVAESPNVSLRDTLQEGEAVRGVGAGRQSGQRARAELAVVRWRLAERNKRG